MTDFIRTPFEGLSDAAHFPQLTQGERIVERIRGEA